VLCIMSTVITLGYSKAFPLSILKICLTRRPIFEFTQFHSIVYSVTDLQEPEYRSRYSDWLRAGRPNGKSSRPGRGKTFLLSTSSRPVLGPTQLPIQWVPEVKRLGRESNHSPPSSADVKNTWIYTSTPLYVFLV
jgi:hypothetical protein